jgi:hypothetical protein
MNEQKTRQQEAEQQKQKQKPPTEQQLAVLPRDLWRFAAMMMRLETQMTKKLSEGGAIFEVGGGDGADMVPFLLALQGMGIANTQFLLTDIADYGSWDLSFPKVWEWQLNQEPTGFTVPMDYSDKNLLLDKTVLEEMQPRLIEAYGEDWDATNAQVFANAEQVLGSAIGLLVLRHPEIGSENETLTNVFKLVIRNLLDQLMSQEVPILITTSNNPLSWQRILETVKQYFTQDGFTYTTYSSGDMFESEDSGHEFRKDDQRYLATWEERGKLSAQYGPRTMDFRILRIFKK